MNEAMVIMGVAGSGKSSLGRNLAQRVGAPFVEGDAYHSPQSLQKMRQGLPLHDEDRESWLDALVNVLRAADKGVVLTCSALKKTYRSRLRAALPRLLFVFLEIPQMVAVQRVKARRTTHGFPVCLVGSQFDTLESPEGESGVLTVDATQSLDEIEAVVLSWVEQQVVL